MSVFGSAPVTPLVVPADRPLLDEAQLAAVAFLARYGGRTLESYRTDLRQFFQWCADVDVAPLSSSRAHIELYRASFSARLTDDTEVCVASRPQVPLYCMVHLGRLVSPLHAPRWRP